MNGPCVHEYSCQAYHNLTKERMVKYANARNIVWPRPKPQSEMDVARVIMTHELPTWSQQEINDTIVEWRGAKVSKNKWGSVLNNASANVMIDCLEKTDLKDLNESVSKSEHALTHALYKDK